MVEYSKGADLIYSAPEVAHVQTFRNRRATGKFQKNYNKSMRQQCLLRSVTAAFSSRKYVWLQLGTKAQQAVDSETRDRRVAYTRKGYFPYKSPVNLYNIDQLAADNVTSNTSMRRNACSFDNKSCENLWIAVYNQSTVTYMPVRHYKAI
jgi:hypothetical protein